VESNWQRIETAPMLEYVLVYSLKEWDPEGTHPIWIARGTSEWGASDIWQTQGTWSTIYPTHWMPLPKDPEENRS
jgi:hypothetical protein